MFAIKINICSCQNCNSNANTRAIGSDILATLPLSRLDSINNDMSKQTQSFSVIIITLSPQ